MLVAGGEGEEGEHAGRGREDDSKLTYIHGLVTVPTILRNGTGTEHLFRKIPILRNCFKTFSYML